MLLIFSSLTYSQSEFMTGNNLGIGAAYTYSANNISKSSSVEGVITFIGTIDLSLQFSTGTVDINGNLKRHNPTLNIKFLLGYQAGSIEENYNNAKMNSSGFLVGAGFYPTFIKSQSFFWMGAIELLYGFNSVAPANVPQNSKPIDTRMISVGFNLGSTILPRFILVLSPFISKDLINEEISVFYGISARMIFSFGLIEQ
ncbi:MAG: hypothetical protein DYG97_15840 [Ignavibacteria bacterium CHB3]|nr:hypothetical protein [Ignavibacteria bacterium CHB3]